MTKRWFLVGGILLLVPLLIVGCGIPQEQYDVLASDLSNAQQEMQSVKGELGAAQAKVLELTSNLGKAETDLESTQTELGATQTDLETTQADLETTQAELETTQTKYDTFKADLKSSLGSLDKYAAVNHYVLGINRALCLDDLNGIEAAATKTTSAVNGCGDSELKSLWEQAYIVESGRWELKFVPFDTFMGSLQGRIKSKATSLRNKLAE